MYEPFKDLLRKLENGEATEATKQFFDKINDKIAEINENERASCHVEKEFDIPDTAKQFFDKINDKINEVRSQINPEEPAPATKPEEKAPEEPAKEPAPAEEKSVENLTHLGKKTTYGFDYDPSLLETFDNKHPNRDYFVKFNCPEFTTLCPITGQPDFATIYISYIPSEKMVESKSLKLYLFSFRNHGDFHEDCVNIIMNDLIKLLDPKYIEVWGKFMPRGGISIDPYCNYGKPNTKWEQVAWERMTHHDLYPENIDNR